MLFCNFVEVWILVSDELVWGLVKVMVLVKFLLSIFGKNVCLIVFEVKCLIIFVVVVVRKGYVVEEGLVVKK